MLMMKLCYVGLYILCYPIRLNWSIFRKFRMASINNSGFISDYLICVRCGCTWT